MFRRDYLEEALHNTGRVDMIWVRCSSPEVADHIAGEIDSTLRNSGTETETASEKTFLVNFMVRFQSLGRLIQAVGLCAVFAIALAVLNGASMTVRERQHEIAVLRTLGFPSLPIVISLVAEASLTALVGGIAGTLLASTGMNAARSATRVLGPALSVGVPYPVMLGAIAIALLIGIISALVPTLAALRSPANNSLRQIA
jgi:putative ABC transport system permease protein